MNNRQPALPLILALAATAAATIAGCSGGSSNIAGAEGKATPITAESFVATGETSTPVTATAPTLASDSPGAAAQPAPAPALTPSHVPGASTAVARRPSPPPVAARPLPPDAVLDTQATVGQPATANTAADAVKSPVVLESLVGQVNGRPVFASEILEPLDAQFRAAARRSKTRAEFLEQVRKPIVNSLIRIVNDELILAEARASLTPEQKQGLFHFLSKIKEDVVSQERGSTVAADEAMRNSAGLTLQQAAKDRLDRELIANEVRQRISPRVIVSWRQIQQQYEKDYAKYNPLPVATYRLISAAADDAPAVEKIKAELASGKPFADVAKSDLSSLSRSDGGLFPPIKLTGKPDQKLFQFPELDAAAKSLTIGQVAGPVRVGTFDYWVSLESIAQEPSVSLYDAQLGIEQTLKDRRLETETDRYFDRLRRRGNVSNLADMATRIFVVAEQRYMGAGVQ